jgi:hypothetical protein
MPTMAKPPKKTQTGEASSTPTPRVRQGKNLNIWMNAALRDGIDLAAQQARPRSTVTAIVELAIEEYLKTVGLWPPKEQQN